MVPALRFGLTGLALCALGWAGATATNLARADALVAASSAEMAAWTASRAMPAEGTWSVVREQLEDAVRIVPNDPSSQELLALVLASRLDKPEYPAAAHVHFSHALMLRPTSPYTWANMAELDYLEGNTGDDFELALRRAAFLGPQEPEVHRTVTDYGLAVWSEVRPETQAAIGGTLRAGLRRNPLEMLQISERRGRLALACRHLLGINSAPDPKWLQICQSTEAIP
jgi:2-polyprenyl-6-methoxyphenol hydroxylase-like FAD-dependent oxidoreductase